MILFYFILFYHFLSIPLMLQTMHWRYKAFDHFQPFLYISEFKDTYIFFKSCLKSFCEFIHVFSFFLFPLQCLQWKDITFLHPQQCMFYVISFFLEDYKCFLSTKEKLQGRKCKKRRKRILILCFKNFEFLKTLFKF